MRTQASIGQKSRPFSGLLLCAALTAFSILVAAPWGCGGGSDSSPTGSEGEVSISLKLSLEIPQNEPPALKRQEAAPCSLNCRGQVLPSGQDLSCSKEVLCAGFSEVTCDIALSATECATFETAALYCEVIKPDDSVGGIFTAIVIPFESGDDGRIIAGGSLNPSPPETTEDGFFGVFEAIQSDPLEGQGLLERLCLDCDETVFEGYCLSLCTYPTILNETHCAHLKGIPDGCPSLCPAVQSFHECLNGVVEAGEQCDPATELGKLICLNADGVCTADCDCVLGGNFGEPPGGPTTCGNHVLDSGEECEVDVGPEEGSLCETFFCIPSVGPPGPRGEGPCTCVAPLCLINGFCERYETLDCEDCQTEPGCFTGPGFCGNERCDEGESGETCSLDCETFCGPVSICDEDGACEVCETAQNCVDCAHCGNLACDIGENVTCPEDCCPECMTCGNGICENAESYPPDEFFPNPDYCPEDCGAGHCGNGKLEYPAGESCDDGNTAGGDGCDSTCHLEFCGDGCCQKVIENRVNCGIDCSRGDGVCEVGGETPANTPEDCSPCPIEPCCGNGTVDLGEECDWGISCPNPDDSCIIGVEPNDCSCVPSGPGPR